MQMKQVFMNEYREKLTTPDEAVKVVKSGDWVDYSLALGVPDLLDKALAKRKDELHDVKIRGYLVMSPLEVVNCDPTREHFFYNSWYMSGYERKLCDQGLCNFSPMLFRNLPLYYKQGHAKVNVAMMQVSPMDDHGYFYFSLACASGRAVMDVADYIILEVNENLPHVQGTRNVVHISEVDAIVEGEHGPLKTMANPEPTEIDVKLADYILEDLRDGSCMQLGIGGLANVIGKKLAESDLKDLGVHTELLCDAFYDLYTAGKITNSKKQIDRYFSVFGLAMGSQNLYDWVSDNPSTLTTSIDYVNSAENISQLDNFVSINNCIAVDLYGQTNSESSGSRQISGTGGQLDFLTGAVNSNGGQAFICMTSSFVDKQGVRHSRVVPKFNGDAITDPRSQAFILVTEYGKVSLIGKTDWERAEALISVAHPDFREDLIKEAEALGVWRRSNKR